MILRRITEHVKAQNWTAVALDFVIVVVGVLFALSAEQWMSEGQQRDELASAEVAFNADLLTNLFSIKEILAIAPCRKQRTKILSALLEEDSPEWPGAPWAPHPGAYGAELPELLPTPYRFWGSRAWEAEMRNGTLATMDSKRRRSLDGLFAGTNLMLARQEDIFEAQSRLKLLAIARQISPADRTRYLEILHYHDQQSGLLERVARQTLPQIEAANPKPDQTYIAEFGEYMPGYIAERLERYGDCFVPFEMPFLENAMAGKGTQ